MIQISKLYEATNQGLDIINMIYPQAEVGKKFRIRERDDDKTPSTSLQKRKIKVNGAECEVWGLTDFGGDGSWRNPIDLYMYENSKSQEQFYEALQEIAQHFNVCETVDARKNIPKIEKRPALPEEKDGTRKWNVKEKATIAELAVMGRTVKQNDMDALGWKSVDWITNTKDGQTTIKYSTDDYPIFIRECVIKDADNNSPAEKFYKIYEPMNADKGFRFQVYPTGGKPKDYVNGMYELRREHQAYNDKKREELESDSKNDGKQFHEQKLPMVVICSGERDALCCHSMGVPPIWINSETARLEQSVVKELQEYADTIFNIPDIDDTGIREGKKLALRYLDIKTVWLPPSLRKFRDHRGRPRKDLHDWMDLHPMSSEFYELLKGAISAKFWVKGDKGLTLDTANLHYFLQLNGFATFEDEYNRDEQQLILVNGYEVTKVFPRDIRKFLRRWVSKNVRDHEVLNLVLNSTKLSALGLEALQDKQLDFTCHTLTSQTYFFQNVATVVTGKEIKLVKREDYTTSSSVWTDTIIQHDFKLLNEDFFTVTREVDDNGKLHFRVHIEKVPSNLMGYFINSSRLHWRKEMETRFGTQVERDAYVIDHKFDLEGEGLTEEEKAEQLQNFLNKVFAAGYMLHHYKDPSKPWAPYAMDHKIGEEGECNGGSGKSIFFYALQCMMPYTIISGKDPRIFDNPHTFERVTRQTRMVVIDDCAKTLDVERFFDRLTGDFPVNPKNKTIYTLPFTVSPKMGFSTNFVPQSFDASTQRRMLMMVFSDYYHQQTEDNDYLETRKVSSDFGKNILPPYATEEEWNADLNFLLQCLRFYLSVAQENIMITPPMTNIITRKNLAVMGDNFMDWASGYFSEDSGRLNVKLEKDKVYTDCILAINATKMTPHTFTKKLKAFVAVADWIQELNPKELQNKDGRIKADGKEYIFLRTKDAPF